MDPLPALKKEFDEETDGFFAVLEAEESERNEPSVAAEKIRIKITEY